MAARAPQQRFHHHLARALARMKIAAEGVDTQLDLLRAARSVTGMQGYLFSVPEPRSQIDDMLRRPG
jgi:EAL domain-containing protein (putative c-di-GMP-specific phosphodiesterase class I)